MLCHVEVGYSNNVFAVDVVNIVMTLVREYMLRMGTRRQTLHGPLNLVPGV